MHIPQDDGDLNAQYDAEMRTIATKAPKEVKTVSESEHQEDYYKGFRSAVVLVWMFCNLALCAVVLSAGGLETIKINHGKVDGSNRLRRDNPPPATGGDNKSGSKTQSSGGGGAQNSTIYMGVVLWSVAGLSLFRFCGAIWFLVVRLVSLSSFQRDI